MLKKFLENRKESDNLISKLDNFMKNDIFNIMQGMWTNSSPSKFDTIVHGDFWSANILYKYDDDDNPERAILVDFQQIDLGNPCRDIFSFLYSSTDSSFRAKHLDNLLKKGWEGDISIWVILVKGLNLLHLWMKMYRRTLLKSGKGF